MSHNKFNDSNDRGISVVVWMICACVLVMGAATLLPRLAVPSNCGGNSAALASCRNVVVALQTIALDRGGKSFRVDDLSYDERDNFRDSVALSWIPDARIFVTSELVTITEALPRKIITVCDRPYDNVPKRRFGRSPMRHAVAYSDGSVGLIAVSDFKNLDLSRFVDVATIPRASTNQIH